MRPPLWIWVVCFPSDGSERKFSGFHQRMVFTGYFVHFQSIKSEKSNANTLRKWYCRSRAENTRLGTQRNPSLYASAVIGITPDRAFGRAICRGDITDAKMCCGCLDDAIVQLRQPCTGRTPRSTRTSAPFATSPKNFLARPNDNSLAINTMDVKSTGRRSPTGKAGDVPDVLPSPRFELVLLDRLNLGWVFCLVVEHDVVIPRWLHNGDPVDLEMAVSSIQHKGFWRVGGHNSDIAPTKLARRDGAD